MTIQLLFHDPISPSSVSPFDEVIRSIACEGQLSLACPYISLDYLNQIIDGTSWRLLTDIEEWLRNQAVAQREKAVDFLCDHRASVRHYRLLHAKVVIGLRTVMFGSANFTNSGIWKRAEVSAIIDDAPQVEELTEWFEGCWSQSQELPSNDAMAEYIRSLPEVPAHVEGDVVKLFPPLSTMPASLAESEGQEVTTGEAAEQSQAQDAEPAPEEDEDEVVFSYVRPKSAIDAADTKRPSGNLHKRRYLFCLIRVGRKATREDIPFLHALVAKLSVLTPKRFGPNADTGDNDRERGIRRAVRLARNVSEDSLQALRDAANDAALLNTSNEPQYSEEFYPQIREELGIK